MRNEWICELIVDTVGYCKAVDLLIIWDFMGEIIDRFYSGKINIDYLNSNYKRFYDLYLIGKPSEQPQTH